MLRLMIMMTEVMFLRELPPSTTLSTATATSCPHNPCYWVLGKERHMKNHGMKDRIENQPKVVERMRERTKIKQQYYETHLSAVIRTRLDVNQALLVHLFLIKSDFMQKLTTLGNLSKTF